MLLLSILAPRSSGVPSGSESTGERTPPVTNLGVSYFRPGFHVSTLSFPFNVTMALHKLPPNPHCIELHKTIALFSTHCASGRLT